MKSESVYFLWLVYYFGKIGDGQAMEVALQRLYNTQAVIKRLRRSSSR